MIESSKLPPPRAIIKISGLEFFSLLKNSIPSHICLTADWPMLAENKIISLGNLSHSVILYL